MEQAVYNTMYKTKEELEREQELREKAIAFYENDPDKVSKKYWEVYGDMLGKEFYLDNLDLDEIVDFVETYFEEEIDGNN